MTLLSVKRMRKNEDRRERKTIERGENMKEKEALKYLKDFVDNDTEIGAYNTEVLKKAIEALEKQILKKPYYDGHTFACPNCKTIFLIKTGEVRGLRCKWCGQAIDWCDIGYKE